MHLPFSFEPILQQLRIRQVRRYIPNDGVLVDLGCDIPPVLINKLKDEMKHCYGLDIIMENQQYDNVTFIQQDFQKKIKLKDNIADAVTMLAVLEHVKHPADIVKECFRILKKDGVLLITVPAPKGKWILELFAKIGVVRDEMIEQHENYFTEEELQSMLSKAGFSKISTETFEWGYNIFVLGVK